MKRDKTYIIYWLGEEIDRFEDSKASPTELIKDIAENYLKIKIKDVKMLGKLEKNTNIINIINKQEDHDGK